MRRFRVGGALLLSGTIIAMATGASAEDMGTQASAVENFPSTEALLTSENATIERREDGVTIDLKLVTPEAGSYTYRETVGAEQQAQPELFTGWAFVFNHPELCEVPHQCGPGDFNDQVRFGVYNFAGSTNQLSQESGGEIALNAASEGYVRVRGDILAGQEQRPDLPPDVMTFTLENPMGAEIHAAIAPHGQLDMSTIAQEINDPVGDPACSCWWVAIFQGFGAPVAIID